MKHLLRNPTFRRELLSDALLGALAAILGFLLHPAAGLAALALTAAFLLLSVLQARRRYAQMADLASLLDAILHGQEAYSLDAFSEGELSILQSELSKLLAALRRQSEDLTADKKYLADALADISHQLRTPLTSLNLAAAMLAAPDLPDPRRQELARDLTRQLTRIEWLVSSLLKMSRLDAGTADLSPQPVPLSRIVSAAAEPLLIPLELKGVALHIDLMDDPDITVDPAWTAEALGNLLKNCMEHTPSGGSVIVAAQETAIFTELTVTDTGPGFDPEDMPRLFDRFYRGRDASPTSAGIGLALSRSILQSSHATLKAENAPRGGARFIVKFYKSAV